MDFQYMFDVYSLFRRIQPRFFGCCLAEYAIDRCFVLWRHVLAPDTSTCHRMHRHVLNSTLAASITNRNDNGYIRFSSNWCRIRANVIKRTISYIEVSWTSRRICRNVVNMVRDTSTCNQHDFGYTILWSNRICLFVCVLLVCCFYWQSGYCIHVLIQRALCIW